VKESSLKLNCNQCCCSCTGMVPQYAHLIVSSLTTFHLVSVGR